MRSAIPVRSTEISTGLASVSTVLAGARCSCGHPRIEQILAVTEQVLDVPIRAVVGGLHLPVHAARTPLVPQAVLGTRTRPGSRSANATPGTCWSRSRPAGRGSSPCPGTTAPVGL